MGWVMWLKRGLSGAKETARNCLELLGTASNCHNCYMGAGALGRAGNALGAPGVYIIFR